MKHTERWVNARIELVVVLDGVNPDADIYTQQEAVGAAVDDLLEKLPAGYADDIVISARPEVMTSED